MFIGVEPYNKYIKGSFGGSAKSRVLVPYVPLCPEIKNHMPSCPRMFYVPSVSQGTRARKKYEENKKGKYEFFIQKR